MCTFLKSAFKQSDWICDSKQEICFVGRSNVGKSSIVNLLSNKKIANISNTPGSTKGINFYDFSKYRLIDLPGYGYSKHNKQNKNLIYEMIFDYLNYRENIIGVFHVINIDVITQQDIDISYQLNKKFLNYYIVFNKLDKVSKNFLNANINKFLKTFNLGQDKMLFISCKNKENGEKLKKLIDKLVK